MALAAVKKDQPKQKDGEAATAAKPAKKSKLLWIVLGMRLSFRTAAVSFGRQGVRGLRYTVDRFRDALAVLAEAKAAKGREVRRRAGR